MPGNLKLTVHIYIIFLVLILSVLAFSDCENRAINLPPGQAVIDTAASDALLTPSDEDIPADFAAFSDSSTADTAKVDTIEAKSKPAEIDTIITYSADSVYFSVEDRITILYRNARVKHRDMELTAGKITVRWDEDLMLAEWILDTLWRDSAEIKMQNAKCKMQNAKNKTRNSKLETRNSNDEITVPEFISVVDTVVKVGFPKFRQKNDVIDGEFMTFNLKSKQGYVIEGETEYGDGSYFGERIKRVSDEVMNVADGYYTTCDLDTPHYHFRSKQMKLIVKNKVVAKPVVLYFERVPVAIIPFGIFPTRSGRRSGIIVPTYGESASQGRFFRHLGYYYAESQYLDARASLDFFERFGIRITGDARYSLRSRLGGNIYGSYDRKQKRYDIGFRHNQTITPTSGLRADAYYVSDTNYIKDLNMNPIERMNRNIRSNASFSKRFPGLGGSFALNLNHQLNLDTEESSFTVPQASFSLSQRAFFPGKKDEDDRWFNKIYFSARSNYTNRHQKNQFSRPITVQDTTSTGQDTTYQSAEKYYKKSAGAVMKNGFSISSPQTVLKYFNINPSMSINQDWTDKIFKYRYVITPDSANPPEALERKREYGLYSRNTASFSTSLTTKIYGLFPGIGSIEAFRHVVTPSISFRYTPDFSNKFWGYYQYLTDSSGVKQKFDRFADNSMMGGTPANEAKSMNFSVDNLFQMKRVLMKGEEEVTQKLDLFSLTFATSYNFMKDSQNWSNLSSRLRAQPLREGRLWAIQSVSLDLSASHSFYAYNSDKYYYEGGNLAKGKILRLTSMGINSNIRLSSTAAKKKKESPGKSEPQAELAETQPDTVADEFTVDFKDHYTSPDEMWQPKDIPWSLNLSLSYNLSQPNPSVKNKSFWMNGNLDMSLTSKWKLGYTTRVDLVKGEVVSRGLTLYRDMHCWEGRLQWYPSGVGQGFFVKINVKSPGLQDLKIEKRRGIGGAYGY